MPVNTKGVASAGAVIQQVNIADVFVFKILKCARGIATVAFTTIFVTGKAVKIVKAVQAARKWAAAVGGANTARLLVGASTETERARVLASARAVAGTSGSDVSGITQIQPGCF